MVTKYINLNLVENDVQLKVIDDILQVGITGSAVISGIVVVSGVASEAHIGEVGGHINKCTSEFTRAGNTTGYHTNDTVGGASANIFELANAMRIPGETAYLVGLRVVTNLKSITPRLRVHFFNDNAATISADGAVWQDKYADKERRIGSVDLSAMTTAADATNSDMSRAVDLALRVPLKCTMSGTSIWYAFETLDAFTPASGQMFYTVALLDTN